MKILFLHASAGHGHQKIAEVAAKAFVARGIAADQVQVFDALKLTPPVVRWAYPASYFYSVKYMPGLWGWFYENLDHPGFYRVVKPFRELHNTLAGKKLLEWVIKENPEHLIFTHFLSAELFSRAKKQGKIKSRLTTIITDFFPHHVWMNEGTDHYWVMNETSKAALVKMGVPANMITPGGIPVDPQFRPLGKRAELRKKYGLEDKRFTVLLSSGAFALGPQLQILREMECFSDKVQAIAVCGGNKELKKTLEAEKFKYPVKIFGFVDYMAELMEASDLLVAKPGGSTTVESLAKGLPMVVFHPIPGQEQRNADFMKEHNAAFFMQEPYQIRMILRSIFENPHLLEEKHTNIGQIARPNAADDFAKFILGVS